MIINILNYALLTCILLLLAMSIMGRHRLLLALYLIGLSELGNIFPIFSTIRFELLIGAVVLLMLIFGSGQIIGRSNTEVSKYFYFFFLLALMSVPQSVSPGVSLFWFIYYLKKCFIYYFGVVLFIDSEDRMREFVWVMMLGMFWFFGVPFVQYLQGNYSVVVKEVERVEGATGLNPNGLANNIIQVLPYYFYMFVCERRILLKVLLLLMGLIGFSAVFMTGSRGGFIGIVFLALLLAVWSKRKGLALAIGSVVFTVAMFVSSGALISRYSTILEFGGSGLSAHSRSVGLVHGISMLLKRPILGVGIGAYPVARKMWFNWGLWAHHLYGQLMGELGILGTLAWCLMVYYTIRYARRIRKRVEGIERYRYFHYLMLAVEISMYTRLVLGLTNHALHIAFWYISAAMVVAAHYITNVAEGDETESGKTDSTGRRKE
jgi:hypothetical protein